MSRSSLLLAAALDYASDGWHVLPLHTLMGEGLCSCNRADCGSPAKHPLTKTGLTEATTDAEQISLWWERWPEANVGVRTGLVSGIVVLDVDSYNGGDEGLAALVAEYGTLPSTMVAATGGGGRHLIFAHPGESIEVRNKAGLATGVDVRGDGGYIVAPPSLHVSGAFYEWSDTMAPAALPGWLVEQPKPVRKPLPAASTIHSNPSEHPWVKAAFDGEIRDLRFAAEGTRNAQLNRSAFNLGQLVPHALSYHEVESALHAEAAAIGLAEREIAATIRSGLDAGMDEPRAIPAPREPRPASRAPAVAPETAVLDEPLLFTPQQAMDEFEHFQTLPKIPIIGGWVDLSMRPKQLMVVLARTGQGKGHPLDTEVPTPNGMRRWGDLAVGDEIYGSDGTATKVVGVYDRGILPTYRVTFSDGSSVLCDRDHLWTLQTPVATWRDRRRARVLVEKTLSVGELAALDLRDDRGRGYRYTIPMTAPVCGAPCDLPVDAYALGALIANGYLCGGSAVLSTIDVDVASRVNEAHQAKQRRTPEGACPSYIVHGVIGAIRSMGLCVRSKDKFIPESYLCAPIDQRVALLQGLMDCDGMTKAHRNRRSVCYFTSSPQLADDVVRLVSSLGGTARQRWTQRSDDPPEACLSIMLPAEVAPFSSARKSASPVMAYRTGPRRALVGIERMEDQPIRCIAVGAADSLYLIGRQHVVTHNTTWIVNTMHQMAMNSPELRFLFVSLEQTKGEWFDRANRLRSFYDLDLSMKATVDFWTPRLRIIDANRLGQMDLVESIEQVTEELGAKPVVFVDYLGYWAQSFVGDAYHRTSDAIMALKAIAKHCEVAVVAPHQVSRETGSTGRPSAEKARDSGKVNETADFLLTLWYPDMELTPEINGPDLRSGIIHIYVDKSRSGGVGRTMEYQMAPLTLAMVARDDSRRRRAEIELEMVVQDDARRFGQRATWQDAVAKHSESAEPVLARTGGTF